MSSDKVITLFSDNRPQPKLCEDDVTIDKLKTFIEAAVLDYEIDDDGDIYIKSGVDFPFWVRIEEKSRLIQFYTFWEPKFCSFEQVNEINNYRIAQFLLFDQRIHANYYLTYRYGLDARHLIVMAREFGSICRVANTQLHRATSEPDETKE